MPFYTYHQNNSGGGFRYDATAGISVNVIVEAPDHNAANRTAEEIGLYWDGCEHGMDCPCCGDRWSRRYQHDGQPTPQVYGETVQAHALYPADDPQYIRQKWMEDGQAEGFIHYADGRIEPFHEHQAERQDLAGQYGWGVSFWKNATDVFMVGANGWDETGNRQAPGKNSKEPYSWSGQWVKPDKPVIRFASKEPYGNAWFPTEEEARAFADHVAKIGVVMRERVQSIIKTDMKTQLDKNIAGMWNK